MWLIIVLVVVVIIFLALRKSGDNSGSTSSSASGSVSSNLDVSYLDGKLDTLYDAYSELLNNGYTDKIYQITLYSKSQNTIGIDVQLDGSYFLNGMNNDILTAYYTLPAGEDPSTWHIRSVEFPSKPVSNRELASYINGYKQRNSDKGKFLDLLRAQGQ